MAKYDMECGFSFEYDPTRTLPPDRVSERLGNGAAKVINTIQALPRLGISIVKPLNVLSLGVGTGIELLATLAGTDSKTDLRLFGIDIDPYCINLTKHNIDSMARSYKTAPRSRIWQADWKDPATWLRLSKQTYSAILFNPPFLPKGEKVRPGYEQVPEFMMYTNDSDGLEHYKAVTPHLIDLLSENEGSTLFIRLSLAKSGKYIVLPDWEKLVRKITEQHCLSYRYDARQVTQNRWGLFFTVSRANTGLPPQENPLVDIALKERLSSIPKDTGDLFRMLSNRVRICT